MRITLEIENAEELSKFGEYIAYDEGEIKFKNAMLPPEFFDTLSKMNCVVSSGRNSPSFRWG